MEAVDTSPTATSDIFPGEGYYGADFTRGFGSFNFMPITPLEWESLDALCPVKVCERFENERSRHTHQAQHGNINNGLKHLVEQMSISSHPTKTKEEAPKSDSFLFLALPLEMRHAVYDQFISPFRRDENSILTRNQFPVTSRAFGSQLSRGIYFRICEKTWNHERPQRHLDDLVASDPLSTRTMDSRTPWYVRNPIDPMLIFAGIINGDVPPENLPSGWNLTGQRIGNWPEASCTYGKPNVPKPEDLDEGPENPDWSEEEEEFGEDSNSDSDMEMADVNDGQQQLTSHDIPSRFKRRRRLSRQPYRLLINPILQKCCDNHCGVNDNVVVYNWLGWDPELEGIFSLSSTPSSSSSANSVLCTEKGDKATCRYIPSSHYTGLLQLSQISPFITREFASCLFFNSVFEFPEGPSLFPHFVRNRPAVLPLMRGVILHVECSADFLDTVDLELVWMIKFIRDHEEINLRFFTVVLNTGLINIFSNQTDEERQLYKVLVMKKLESWAPLFRELRTEDFLLDMRPLPGPDPVELAESLGKLTFEDTKVIAREIIDMWLPDCLRKEKEDETTDRK